jgi:ketosteroid isomerase-like protein
MSAGLSRRSLVGLVLLTAPSLQAVAASDSADTSAVQNAFDRFIAAFNTLDWQTFSACLADDVALFNPDIPEVSSLHRLDGRAAVEGAFRAVFQAGRTAAGAGGPHIVPDKVRIQAYTDTAVVSFEFNRGAGSFGRRTVVFHRQDARDWRIVHIHASNTSGIRPVSGNPGSGAKS